MVVGCLLILVGGMMGGACVRVHRLGIKGECAQNDDARARLARHTTTRLHEKRLDGLAGRLLLLRFVGVVGHCVCLCFRAAASDRLQALVAFWRAPTPPPRPQALRPGGCIVERSIRSECVCSVCVVQAARLVGERQGLCANVRDDAKGVACARDAATRRRSNTSARKSTRSCAPSASRLERLFACRDGEKKKGRNLGARHSNTERGALGGGVRDRLKPH